MKKRIQHLVWAKNCVKRTLTGHGRNYLKLARWHVRQAVSF